MPGAAEPRMPMAGMMAVLTLTRNQVREGYHVRGQFKADPDEALTGKDRERMRAALSDLKDRGKIGLTDRLVWLL